MKYLILSFYIIVFGIILENDANASSKVVPRSRSDSALTDQDLHEGFFKSARLGTQEFTLNRIANLPEIFRCGTPIEQSRIVATLNEMDGMLSGMVSLLGDTITYLNNPELSSKNRDEEIAQTEMYIAAIQATQSLFISPTPPTINRMVANLSAINGYLRVSQKRLLRYLQELSDKTQVKTNDFFKNNASLPLNCISSNSFQLLKGELEKLSRLKENIFTTLKQLNRYYDMNQSFLLILSDFYLQPRNPEAAKICSTDQYLGYLNRSIVGEDIVNRSSRAISVY